MTTLLKISTRVLSMVRPTMAENDIRYYLNGIHVEANPAGGVIAVATDGHRLTACFDPSGVCKIPMIVRPSSDAWRYCDKPQRADMVDRAKCRVMVVDFDERAAPVDDFGSIVPSSSEFDRWQTTINWEIADKAGSRIGVPVWRAAQNRDHFVEGKFPDWRRVLPKTAEEWAGLLPCAGALNVDYVAALRQHVGKHKYAAGVRFWQKADPDKDGVETRGGAVLVQFDGYAEIVVCVMPLRVACDTFPFPEFMQVAQ